ncbi:hypothetical protein R1sor_016050 [Riccia sorocarpa]|uniref:Uncharacterized protein n=1 Tax=Riccia sorocarpa TaxID=122646 RepID=A0ABD3HI33_9MARC
MGDRKQLSGAGSECSVQSLFYSGGGGVANGKLNVVNLLSPARGGRKQVVIPPEVLRWLSDIRISTKKVERIMARSGAQSTQILDLENLTPGANHPVSHGGMGCV